MTPDPCKAHKSMTVPAVWCALEIIVNKLASIAESTTAHPKEMSVNAYILYVHSYMYVYLYVYCKQMY